MLMVDRDSFVYIDGVKIARVIDDDEGGRQLQFIDKDRRRASRRGTDKVTIAVQELFEVLGS